MSLVHGFAVGREQCFQQIDRLIKSHILSGSESLCKLLRYLAEHSLDHPGEALKEYQIATEVLGRSGGFDPQNDSTVRVQAGRLRQKLAEYYEREGKGDAVLVELPKGSYALIFHVLTPGSRMSEVPGRTAIGEERQRRPEGRKWIAGVAVLSVLLVTAVGMIAVLLAARGRSEAGRRESAPAVYQVFWRPFTSSAEEPWV